MPQPRVQQLSQQVSLIRARPYGRPTIEIALNLQIALDSTLIFTILILLIHEHGIFLHLFVSSLISFISVLQFSIYRSLDSLGRYIPKYFINPPHFTGEKPGPSNIILLKITELLSNRTEFTYETFSHIEWMPSLLV